VLLELPEDIAAEDCTEHVMTPHKRYYASPSDVSIEEAVTLIKNAKMPLI